MLLSTLRARPLASLGAVITVLALAFDPFIQQILQYPSILSIDPYKESSASRTSNFTLDPTSADWLNAIGAGIWSDAERYDQQPICPSGNCIWKEYSSTGWCSKCQDATSYAKITNCTLDANILDVDRLNTTDSCLVDFGHGNTFQVLGSHKTSISEIQMSLYRRTNTSTIFRGVVWPLDLLNYNLSIPLRNETYAGVTNPIVALGNVHVQRCNEADGLCITFAEECSLSLCTRQFETSVANGTTDNTITNEDFGCLSQVHDDSGSTAIDSNTHCWQAGEPCADLHFTNLTGFDSEDYPALGFCSNGIIVQTAQMHMGNSVQDKLLSRLTGNQTAMLFSDKSSLTESDTTASSFTMEYITANGLGPVLAGVAASLTQQALLATSEKEMGTVWTTETLVAIDWPWLIYPATLVLGAIVLLALTAMHSHRCGLRIWKSSTLPLLYRSLDPELLARQPVLHDVSAMAGVAGRAKVTLVETSREDGVVLTQ
jgi:hypothetical protein